MGMLKKPAFEGFRVQLIKEGKPLLEKDIVPIQARIVALLDTVPELLVQKARRLSNKEGIVEITATWMGLDASPRSAIQRMKRIWPTDALEAKEDSFYVAESEEAVLLQFAARYAESRYLTGRILITF